MKTAITLCVGMLMASGIVTAQDAPMPVPDAANAVSAAAPAKPFAAVEHFSAGIALNQILVESSLTLIQPPELARFSGSRPSDQFKDVNASCDKALTGLNADLDAALQQAKADPQVMADTKALYIAAQDYFTNLPPALWLSYDAMQTTHSRLNSTLTAKLTELKLDLRLAGQ